MSWNWKEFLLVFAVLLAGLHTTGAQGGPGSLYIQEKRLMKPAHCPGQVISWPHRYRTLGARSVLECVAACRPDARCLSIVFEANAKKCYLGNDTSRPDCSNVEAGEKHMKYYETVSWCLFVVGVVGFFTAVVEVLFFVVAVVVVVWRGCLCGCCLLFCCCLFVGRGDI